MDIVGSVTYAGGGGRVSILADDRSGFSGVIEASQSGANGSNEGAAGTVYIEDALSTAGHLVVDNKNNTSATGSYTPIKSVGRHTITAATDLGGNQWAIAIGAGGVDSSIYEHLSGGIVNNGPGSVTYHNFTLTEARTISLRTEMAEFISPNIHIFVDDGVLDAADAITSSNVQISNGFKA